MTVHKGIYLLANDKVYDQVIAVVNSIEVNYSKDIPICIIPFDDSLDLIRQEVEKRPQLFLFDNEDSIKKWDDFIQGLHTIFINYPMPDVKGKRVEVLTMHRKYCAFDGDFEKFLYIDVDCLVFKSLDHVFDKLDEYEFVVHDFQRKTDLRKGTVDGYFPVFRDRYPSPEILSERFHCGGFWASRRHMLTQEDLAYFLKEAEEGDAKVFSTPLANDTRFLSEQAVINYMTLKKNLKLHNFTLEDAQSEHRTGCNITSKGFKEEDNILYDKGKRLTYLHYMGVKNQRIQRLCQVGNIKLPFREYVYKLIDKVFKWGISDIPYKNVFLHYRFLKLEAHDSLQKPG